jgi:hypothetical protein
LPGNLSITLDDTALLDVNLNLGNTLDLDQGRAWVGFTAGTGSGYENHDLINWSFTAAPEPSTLVLLAIAAIGGLFAWRRRQAA